MRNFNALQANQLLQTLRQVFGLRQARAVDENWNDANAAAKRGLDLDPNEVMLVVDASPFVPVNARNPLRANHRDERIANGDAFGQKFDKIDAGRNAVYVKENILATEPSGQPIIDAPRRPARVFPPVAYEDAARHANALAVCG